MATWPNAVVTEVRPMEALLAASISPHRFRARLLTAWALLAAAGIYGVMSCLVEQRTAEIGARMALGARPTDVFGMVLGRGLALAVAGLVIASRAALMLGSLIAGLLFETSAADPVAIAAAALLLACPDCRLGALTARRPRGPASRSSSRRLMLCRFDSDTV
jgi:hypothetical protein